MALAELNHCVYGSKFEAYFGCCPFLITKPLLKDWERGNIKGRWIVGVIAMTHINGQDHATVTNIRVALVAAFPQKAPYFFRIRFSTK